MSKKPSNQTEQEKPQTRYDRKMEARRQAAAKEKRNTMIFCVICVVIAVAVVGTLGYFGVKKYDDFHNATKEPYVSIGEHELTQLEYDYYFNTTVNNYISAYSYYLSYIGLDTTLPFDEQAYSEDMTWQEYFEQMTLEQLKQEFALLDDAEANGFEYDTTDDYNEFVTTAKTTAKENQITMRNYYKAMFGDYATAKNIKPFMENSYIATAYYDKLIEDNRPSDDEVSNYYKEHKEDYDKVAFYSFTFDPANYTESSDDTAENTDTSTARTLAEEMKKRLEAGEDFESLCEEYATEDMKSYYEAEDSEYSLTQDITCSSSNTSYSDWLSDESRKEGDITIIENSDTGSCYVLKFISRTYDETCLETISSSLATDEVATYMDTLLEDNYEAVDVKGEISYLTSETEDDASEESTDDASDTESLLDTSIIE